MPLARAAELAASTRAVFESQKTNWLSPKLKSEGPRKASDSVVLARDSNQLFEVLNTVTSDSGTALGGRKERDEIQRLLGRATSSIGRVRRGDKSYPKVVG